MRRILKSRPHAMLNFTALCAILMIMAGPVAAAPVIQWLGNNFPFDLSADGKAAAGNTGGVFNAFRWTAETGVVDLGQSTSETIGGGAGTPDISDDGERVSATVVTADSLYATQGIWTKGEGWAFSMPPIPPTGGTLDSGLGSCWGLSGDGLTLTGFYWRPGQAATGTAHANTWSLNDGFEALVSPLRNCRGNDLNYDGSVVVGWSERTDGVWCPTVWENGGFTILHNQGMFTEAKGVSHDGNTIWGVAQDTLTNQRSAAVWIRTETGWQEQILGVLPGTFAGAGQAICEDRAETGDIIVGYNTFDGSPYNNTGFVWTLAEGMVSAADFFTSRGVALPAGFVVENLTAISANGNVIAGFGHSLATPFTSEGFIITLDDAAPVPDLAAFSGVVLEPNYPNPFNPSTRIALSVAAGQDLSVDIFNTRGQLVRRLHHGHLEPGRHEWTWDGRDAGGRQVASGVYLARATTAAGHGESRRMMLVK